MDEDHLLTDAEHELIEKLGECMTDFLRIITERGGLLTFVESDMAEIESKIHDLQARVMAQAAARCYPHWYRRLGRPHSS